MTSSEQNEVKIMGLTFKGAAARQLMAIFPWLVAVAAVAYSAWGPQTRISYQLVYFAKNVDVRLRNIEHKLKIESPEPLNLSDASTAAGYRREFK